MPLASCRMDGEHVVLLHGLGRDSLIMHKMLNYLTPQGFCCHNINYPSTTYSIEYLAEMIFKEIKPLLTNSHRKINFVGPSLGSIIIRYMLQQNSIVNLGRLVMIAPPNKGSEVADFFGRFSFYRKRFGPAGMQLGVKHDGPIKQLQDVDYEAGVIAGDRSVDWLFSLLLIPGPDDGKVSVASTKMNNMADHIVIHTSHPFMPNNLKVMNQTARFLRSGSFDHGLTS